MKPVNKMSDEELFIAAKDATMACETQSCNGYDMEHEDIMWKEFYKRQLDKKYSGKIVSQC